MNIEDTVNSRNLDFEGIPPSYYLLGLLSAFENRFQAMADSQMQLEAVLRDNMHQSVQAAADAQGTV